MDETEDIKARLRSLGDQRRVNPPPPPPSPPAATKAKSEPKPKKKKKKERDRSGTCPTCQAFFKDLPRHIRRKICKPPEAAPEPAPEPIPEPTPEPAPKPSESYDPSKLTVIVNGQEVEPITEEEATQGFDEGEEFATSGFERGDFDLLVNCLPIGGASHAIQPIISLDHLLVPFGEAVAKEQQEPHWSTVDFGKGPGLVAAKFERWLKKERPRMTLLADSWSAEYRAVGSVLRRYARIIIAPIR
ncbi:MAG: hypothetical protein GWM98_04895 [Nitrospinaceae bacterium]|nr:hypothetical protein [Nitrospinaceae bacterium]